MDEVPALESSRHLPGAEMDQIRRSGVRDPRAEPFQCAAGHGSDAAALSVHILDALKSITVAIFNRAVKIGADACCMNRP
jgi:hypothetical protein